MKPILLLDRVAGYFVLLWGWKRVLAALLAGALSALAMAPVFAFPVLFLTFPVYVWLIDSTTADGAGGIFSRFWQGFRIGWLFGFGYFLAGLWWVASAFLVEADDYAWMLPFAVMILPAILSVFWGVATGLARLFWVEGWVRIVALSAFLALAEYLRGTLFTGFPWNAIGYAAMPVPLAMQSASVLGLYGVTLLAIPVFCLAALRPAASAGRGAIAFAAIAVLLMAAHLGFGYWRLAAHPTQMQPDVKLRLVQPAIDQAEKWSREMEDRNFGSLLDLSANEETAPLDDSGVTLLVWPESAFPFILTERPYALTALADLIPDGTLLVAGALRVEQPGSGGGRENVFNSVFTIDGAGEIVGAADKVHLVPFGEYLPFQQLAERLGVRQLTRLPGGFEAGTARPALEAGPAGRFVPLICYEIIFPGQIVSNTTRPDFIVNLTNDAWFGFTPGPFQHWHQSIIRGVEEGLPVVRVANSGISSITDGVGRTIARTELNQRVAIDSALPVATGPTLFGNHANGLFFVICGCFVFVTILGVARSRTTTH